MESPGALPSRVLVFQLVCHFHRYQAYSSKSTVRPKMESCFQDRACSVSSFRTISNPKRWCCESTALNMSANLKNSAVATGLEKVSFHSSPKVKQCQRMLKLPHNCTHLTLVAQRLKCLPAMWETWVQSLGQEDPLEKEMATHSSILAWRIPWMEELGGLQSMRRKESDTTEQLHFPSTEFQTLLLTMMAIPFLLRDSCPQ